MTNFEERLLVQLRGLVPTEPAPRATRHRPRRRALVGGLTVALLAAASAGVFVLSTGAKAAYAVTKNPNGSVTVEVDSMTDAAGLQAALQAAGVNAVVEYLPAGKACQQPWFTPAGRHGAMYSSSGVGPAGDGKTRFTISGDMPGDETLVVTTQTGPGGEQALGLAWATGTVPACQVVDAPAGSGPLGGPPTG
ncbi:MAG TPA: hypothetical protein VGH79_06810 [Gaiellaceae bacterium]|jgi:hypothetical protein